ncbi:PQQ-like beta-propeller repeat protein [Falsirhodobacter deserti]|uniref:outer membrane protein assembly factor BamB family protein n=1 Tax=Falsirhodobacter deserti TaxID=1365611 RepID=UPI001F4D4862|nr:PQQ-like beta-propeller repeat protein [Falsirhodobacter deserti]
MMKATTALVTLAALAVMGCQRESVLPGERMDVRAPYEDTGAGANRAAPISLPAQTAGSWTHRGGNAQHLAGNGQLSAQPSEVWSVKFGAADSRRKRIAAAPVAVGDRVFAMDADGQLAAVSTSGQLLWQTPLRPVGERSSISGGGIAYGEGRVFATTGYGELIALDPASGAVQWRQKLGAAAIGAPTVEGGTVYAVARDGTAWAVDAGTGRVDWTLLGTSEVGGMLGTASPAVAGGSVILPFSTGEVISVLRQSGARQWTTAVAGQRRGRSYALIPDITSDPVVSGRTIYVGNQAGQTVAVNRDTGTRIWAAREGAYGPVAVGGNSVFLVSDEAHLVRLDASTGDTIWSVPMPYYTKENPKRRSAITPHYGPVIAGGRVVVASGDERLRFFDPVNGNLVGEVGLEGGAAAQPAVAGGAIYVVTSDGRIHAFR